MGDNRHPTWTSFAHQGKADRILSSSIADLEEALDILENAAVGVHLVDATGRILYANREELTLLGYPPSEYIGSHISSFHADTAVIDDILQRLSRCETLSNYQARLRARDGSIKWVEINSNVYRQDGRFVHTRCFTRDITALKMAELSVEEEKRKKSEERVRARAAEDALQKMTAFLNSFCHELKNPLTGTLGAVEVLKDNLRSLLSSAAIDSDDEIVRDMESSLQCIEICSQQQLRVMHDVLSWSRVGYGQVELQKAPLLPWDVINDLRSFFDVQTRKHSSCLDFRLFGPSDTAQRCFASAGILVGDAGRLRQVLMNLVQNAVKFTHSGQVVVSMQFRQCLQSHVSDELSQCTGFVVDYVVEDTGIGMTPEEQSCIFVPFAQASPGIQAQYAGYGLGLCISLELAKRMGGSIEVTSEKGVGSQFMLSVPFQLSVPLSSESECPFCRHFRLGATKEELVEEVSNWKTVDHVTRSVIVPCTTAARLILVVDDSEIIHRLLNRHLAEVPDHTVHNAYDGEEALRLIDSGKVYAVIFVDLEMPVLDGRNTIEWIRKREFEKGMVPAFIVVMSGSSDCNLQDAMHIGADAVLTKPFFKQDVLRLVANVIVRQTTSGPSMDRRQNTE
jgi:PAS domain S-box-containing protein